MAKMFMLIVFIIFCAQLQSFAQNSISKLQTATTSESSKQSSSFPSSEQYKNSKLSYKIIPASNKTWCYDILADSRTIIHQPSAPGLPGNEGFTSKEKAAKVAELVISKIKNGEMPPSVSLIEMKKLKAIN